MRYGRSPTSSKNSTAPSRSGRSGVPSSRENTSRLPPMSRPVARPGRSGSRPSCSSAGLRRFQQGEERGVVLGRQAAELAHDRAVDGRDPGARGGGQQDRAVGEGDDGLGMLAQQPRIDLVGDAQQAVAAPAHEHGSRLGIAQGREQARQPLLVGTGQEALGGEQRGGVVAQAITGGQHGGARREGVRKDRTRRGHHGHGIAGCETRWPDGLHRAARRASGAAWSCGGCSDRRWGARPASHPARRRRRCPSRHPPRRLGGVGTAVASARRRAIQLRLGAGSLGLASASGTAGDEAVTAGSAAVAAGSGRGRWGGLRLGLRRLGGRRGRGALERTGERRTHGDRNGFRNRTAVGSHGRSMPGQLGLHQPDIDLDGWGGRARLGRRLGLRRGGNPVGRDLLRFADQAYLHAGDLRVGRLHGAEHARGRLARARAQAQERADRHRILAGQEEDRLVIRGPDLLRATDDHAGVADFHWGFHEIADSNARLPPHAIAARSAGRGGASKEARKPGNQEVLVWPFGGNDTLGFERWLGEPSHEQVQPMRPDLAARSRIESHLLVLLVVLFALLLLSWLPQGLRGMTADHLSWPWSWPWSWPVPWPAPAFPATSRYPCPA